LMKMGVAVAVAVVVVVGIGLVVAGVFGRMVCGFEAEGRPSDRVVEIAAVVAAEGGIGMALVRWVVVSLWTCQDGRSG
jgi:hypothetical protein